MRQFDNTLRPPPRLLMDGLRRHRADPRHNRYSRLYDLALLCAALLYIFLQS